MSESSNNASNKFEFWWKLVLVSSIVLLVFGILLFMIGLSPILTAIFYNTFNSEQNFNELNSQTQAYIQLTTSVLGAIILGWSVLYLTVVWVPLRRREKWAWNAACLSILSWFVSDTLISILLISWANVILNTIVFLIVFIPLLGMKLTNDFNTEK